MTAQKCFFFPLLALLASPLAATATPTYAMVFLPSGFAAAAINNAGHVVGTAGGAAAIFSGGALTSLGAAVPGSAGLAINDRDDVSGVWNSPFGIFSGHAFSYVGGVVHDIGAAQLPDFTTQAVGINNAGQVAFTRIPPVGEAWRAYLYDHGVQTAVGTFGGDASEARAINGLGQVVGLSGLPGGGALFVPYQHAFVFDGGGMRDIGTLGGDISDALDINDAGQIVGYAEAVSNTDLFGPYHPFLYEAGSMRDIGSLGGGAGRANGINSAGLIVGASDVDPGGQLGTHGFLYAGHQMTDLNALVDPAGGWQITSAHDISDGGVILATACNNGACVDVRLAPLAAVPEPAGAGMLGAGLAALLVAARRRRTHARARVDGAWRAPARREGTLGTRTAAAMVALLASPALALATPTYALTTLPNQFTANAIGPTGHIVGQYRGTAAILEDGALRFVAGLTPYSAGFGINARDDVAGYMNGADNFPYETRAFSYHGGALRDLGAGQGAEYSSRAIGINNSGQLAVLRTDPIGEGVRAYLIDHATRTDIGNLGGFWSNPYAINNAGVIVGESSLVPNIGAVPRHAFAYEDGTLRDLGTLGGTNSVAYDINDAGQIVGWASTAVAENYPAELEHAFLYEHGVMRDLGALGDGGARSQARGINASGQVVGGSDGLGFLYVDGQMLDLNALLVDSGGWSIYTARDISDNGIILADACRQGYCSAVRLDPIAAVPEPSAAAMLLAGVAALVIGMLKRRQARRPGAVTPNSPDENAGGRR